MDNFCHFNRLPDDTKAIILRECWSSTYHEIRQLRWDIYKKKNARGKDKVLILQPNISGDQYMKIDSRMINLLQDLTVASESEELLEHKLVCTKKCLYSFALVNKNCNKIFFDLQFRHLQSMADLGEKYSAQDILNLLSIGRAPAIIYYRHTQMWKDPFSKECYPNIEKEILSAHCFDFWSYFVHYSRLVGEVSKWCGCGPYSLSLGELSYRYTRRSDLIAAILKADGKLFTDALNKNYQNVWGNDQKGRDLLWAERFLDFLLLKQLPKHEIFLEMQGMLRGKIV